MINYIRGLFKKPAPLDHKEIEVYIYLMRRSNTLFSEYTAHGIKTQMSEFYRIVQKKGLRSALITSYKVAFDTAVNEIETSLKQAKEELDTQRRQNP